MTAHLTPSQTTGPYFGIALTTDAEMVLPGAPTSISLIGKLTDGEGRPVAEGLVEIWQADADGRYELAPVGAGDGFTGFGRCHTDDEGRFWFRTLKPGPVPHPGGGLQAPHLNLAIFGAGLLKPLRTRVYFDDEEEANRTDPLLSSVDASRRHLLIGRIDGATVHHDIRLQGEDETPFFDV